MLFLSFSNLFPDIKISKSSQSQSFTEGKSYSKYKQTNTDILLTKTIVLCVHDDPVTSYNYQKSRNSNGCHRERLKWWQCICLHTSRVGLGWENSCLQSCHHFLLCCAEQTYRCGEVSLSRGTVSLQQYSLYFLVNMWIQRELSWLSWESFQQKYMYSHFFIKMYYTVKD